MSDKDAEIQHDYDLVVYSSKVQAWVTTKFEKDKHLLSLSVAGIGLLVTLATAVGIDDIKTAIIYVIAVTCFLVCTIVILTIFDKNSDYLLASINSHESVESPDLDMLDSLANKSFITGIIFTLLVGLFSSIDNYKGNTPMTDDTRKQTTKEDKRSLVTDSMKDISALRKVVKPTPPKEVKKP